MEKKLRGIVLTAKDHKENDRLITLFTQEGRLTAVVKGVKKPAAKLKFAAQLFNYGEYMLAEKNGYHVVANCSQINSFYTLCYRTESYYAAGVACELLMNPVMPQDADDYLTETVKYFTFLCEGGNTDALLALYLYDYLLLSGYAPDESNFGSAEKELLGRFRYGYGEVFDIQDNKTLRKIISEEEKQLGEAVGIVNNLKAYQKL